MRVQSEEIDVKAKWKRFHALASLALQHLENCANTGCVRAGDVFHVCC